MPSAAPDKANNSVPDHAAALEAKRNISGFSTADRRLTSSTCPLIILEKAWGTSFPGGCTYCGTDTIESASSANMDKLSKKFQLQLAHIRELSQIRL